MKKITLLAALVCSTLSFMTNAQIVVSQFGQVEMGPENSFSGFPMAQYDTITTLRVYGPGVEYSQGRIAFGDSYAKGALNAIVGEVRPNDTDQLWLHGKFGWYFTTNHHAQDTIFYYDVHKGDYCKFNTGVVASSFSQPSDSRFKTNINPLEGALDALIGLQSVTYNLKSPEGREIFSETGSGSDKEARDNEFFNNFYENRDSKNASRLHYGFIAQELKEVFPDLVETDQNGYMYVDYVSLVPVLVEALKELKGELEELKSDAMQESPLSGDNQLGSASMEVGSILPKLYQNTPNPFNVETVIRYALPESVQNANLYIYDLQGKQLKGIAIEQRGESQVTIHGSDLQAGMYIYALIADGQEIDSKRMILTK